MIMPGRWLRKPLEVPMLTPAGRHPGVRSSSSRREDAVPDACPPSSWRGIGGTSRRRPSLQERPLRELGSPNAAPHRRARERAADGPIAGDRPQGYGGDTTSFCILPVTFPAHHVAAVAVTIDVTRTHKSGAEYRTARLIRTSARAPDADIESRKSATACASRRHLHGRTGHGLLMRSWRRVRSFPID